MKLLFNVVCSGSDHWLTLFDSENCRGFIRVRERACLSIGALLSLLNKLLPEFERFTL